MLAGACYPVFTLISPKVGHLPPFIVFSFVIALLLIYTHRKNIKRLREGTESKIYVWKSRKVREAEAARKAANEPVDQSIDEVVEEFVEEFMEEQPQKGGKE